MTNKISILGLIDNRKLILESLSKEYFIIELNLIIVFER